MLGTIFGASVISLIEIIYFLTLSLVKRIFKIQDSIKEFEATEFASSSTVHGVQFIFSKSRHKIIRIFWISSFVFAVLCCMYNSRESYWKLNVTPETETTESLIPMEEIPFPAISICSPFFARSKLISKEFKFRKFFQMIKTAVKGITREDYYHMVANYYWQATNMVETVIKNRNRFFGNMTSWKDAKSHPIKTDLFPYLNRSHFEVDELFYKCNFQGIEVRCSKLFRKVMTILGICYSFNMQSHNEIFNDLISKNFDSYGRFDEPKITQWSQDRGYFDQRKDQYPVRASYKNELDIFLKLNNSYRDNFMSSYKVYAHLPNEILTHVLFENLLYFNYKKLMRFSAKSTKMDESLRKFLPENRGCFFEDERKLKYFRTYSRSNCIMECLSNYTLDECNCTTYLLLHDNSTQICASAKDSECYDDSLKDFPPGDDSFNPCGCLPNCNTIDYDFYDGEQSIPKDPK
jgi:acid-sensing ion channel, other